ncbi:MAG: hypothetical protein IKE62_04125 [Oscillospiraceae bacterium]|nr:hypothetical protein [Oscillospiraceae bacterium]
MKKTNLFAPLNKMPFTTAGSKFTLSTTNGGDDSFGYGKLVLGTNHSGGRNRKCKFFRVQLTYKGRLIPCAYTSTPTELRMESDYGCVKFCYPEPHLLCFKGEGDVGLRIYGPMGPQHESCRDMLDGTWQICWTSMNNWLFVPISGKFTMDAPYDYVGTQSKYICADYEKDGDTPFEGIIEESALYAQRRPSYPSYEQGLKDSTDRFNAFLENTAPCGGVSDEFRTLAAWVAWTHIAYPEKHNNYRYTMIRSQQECMPFAMAWHQYYHACTFRKDKELVWEFIQSLFAHIREDGMLPDSVNDDSCQFNGCKPPIQGFSFIWLMDHTDIFEGENERIAPLADKLEQNLGWWMRTHDLDHNGIPEYQHSDESGLDDSSAFKAPPIESPDLVAYMAMGYEALSRFRKMLGDEAAAEKHMASSKALLDYLVNKMWDGEKFTVRAVRTGELIDTWSIMIYLPAILGKRLPENIREKLCADIMNEDMYLAPTGIRTESASSFDYAGLWTLGAVIPPIQFIVCTGLDACGHPEFAAEATRRYVKFLTDDGFDIGDCTDNRLWLHDLWCSWTASIGLFLGTWFLK